MTQNSFGAPGLERLRSSIPGLDTVLGGGFFRSGVYILQGLPGCGKTIFANQLCYGHVTAGGRAVYVTLLAESHARMLQHIRPLDFYDESMIPTRLTYMSAFKELEMEGLKGLTALLRREMRALNATVLVLDGLVAATEAAETDRELKKFLKPSNSPGQWKTITQELTIVPRIAKTGTGHVLDQLAEKLTHRSLIVVLSDFFDDIAGIQQGLRHLRYKKHEMMVFQVLDPMEIEFPFEDVTLFKGLEQMGDLLTEPRALREGYLEQLNEFTDELKKMCRGMHVDFTRMNSGDPLDVALSNFLATRAASIK